MVQRGWWSSLGAFTTDPKKSYSGWWFAVYVVFWVLVWWFYGRHPTEYDIWLCTRGDDGGFMFGEYSAEYCAKHILGK